MVTVGPIVAVDLGGTALRVALVDRDGQIVDRAREATRSEEGPERVVDRIIGIAGSLIERQGVPTAIALGAAVASPQDDKGVLYSPPNLEGWNVVPLRDMLAQRFGGPVWIGNDASLSCLGEYVFGRGQGVSNLIYLTVSTGIGGGVVADNVLLAGHRGLGPELGHIIIDGKGGGEKGACGHSGCLEMMASGTAIATRARAALESGVRTSLQGMVLGQLGDLRAEHVFLAGNEGDVFSRELVETVARDLSFGLVSLIHTFNPRLIIMGGSVAVHNWTVLGPLVRKHLEEHTFSSFLQDFDIEISEFGDDAGLMGAAALVRQNLGG